MSSTATCQLDNDLYDRMSDTWWGEHGSLNLLKSLVNPWRVPYFQRILIQRKIAPQGKRALDVGCGGGLLTEEVAAMGFTVTGIDPSEKSLDAARAHAAQRGLSIHYRRGYGDTLPFENASFEVVYCCDVLEHIRNWDAVIGEIARVLRHGGTFFYDTINRTLYSKLTMIKVAQEWTFTRILPSKLHAWKMFIRPDELKASLRRHGLQNKDIVGTTTPGNPMKTLRALRQYKAGKISGAELGKQVGFTEGTNIRGSYMGYAVKS
jgi:2-polyprenyl-6-hydroxyphenyl methylase/3-demethylubiquinone-9 3-methyltransferase